MTEGVTGGSNIYRDRVYYTNKCWNQKVAENWVRRRVRRVRRVRLKYLKWWREGPLSSLTWWSPDWLSCLTAGSWKGWLAGSILTVATAAVKTRSPHLAGVTSLLSSVQLPPLNMEIFHQSTPVQALGQTRSPSQLNREAIPDSAVLLHCLTTGILFSVQKQWSLESVGQSHPRSL